MSSTIATIAFHDMREDYPENCIVGSLHERYIVGAVELDTKETRRMNQALGLWGINKGKHNMTRKKKIITV